MQTECSAEPMLFARLDRRDLVADFGGGAITSDAGALLLGATDRAIGLIDRFAACFSDGRDPGRVAHELPTLIGQRVFAIALGYEDLVDHDELRRDPALGAVLGRLEAKRPGLAPLAGKSTLNRLEHAPAGAHRYRRIGHDGAAVEELFVDLFLEAHANPRFVVTSLKPREIAARTLYEKLYCARGDMENRIKECQLDLFADRTSAATMCANQLRLWFASMAYALLSALRRRALAHTELARATCGTIRAKLLKIGALVTVSVRRVRIAMASACPYAAVFRLAHRRLCG